MSSVPLSTTDAVFSHEHRLPRYPVGARKTTPTSISYTATTRTIPQNVRLVDIFKYTQLAEDYKEKVLGSDINQHLVVEGGSVLQRNAEQDNVVLFHTHIAHPTLEIGHPRRQMHVGAPTTPPVHPQTPAAAAAASGEAKSDADKATTSIRSTRPTKRKRISSQHSIRVSPVAGSHVEVRPDMIVVLDPADARKINLKQASLEAESVCITCVEMKRTGVLASRLWEHGVGDVMEVGILEEGDSEKMRAAFLGANIEASKDLQETGRFNVGL
ncbi:hypothetical protein JMJ77_0001744 [Colletotrichum scovillei]|uniref:Uncharacterized protein n=1 Tax=Colletotrichum scovillei TaxID=1209932 RepID=A0A9P7R6K1_9PEZI|nr:hypothetical protein JMJ77_0001744 [Colletotrichum scovillei]